MLGAAAIWYTPRYESSDDYERSLAFGRAIAEKLQSHPEFIDRARQTLQRWMITASPRVRPTLQEWLTILNGEFTDVIAVLTGTDQRSTRLRQSNPFTGVLSNSERNAILRRYHRLSQHDSPTA
jgi:hypothetical protein